MEISIANLRYIEDTNTLIDMDVTFANPMSPDEVGPMPFTYSPDDQEPVSLTIRALLKAGTYGITPYTPPRTTSEQTVRQGANVIA